MKEINKTKTFWYAVVSSICCYVILCWVNAMGDMYLSSCVYTVSYFYLTWLWLERFYRSINRWIIVWAVVLGFLLCVGPIWIVDSKCFMYDVLLMLSIISAIVLSAICYKERKMSTYILSFVILLLLNSVGQYVWLNKNPFIHL